MASKHSEDLIRITHYVNPHMFWFKYESSFLGNTKLFELENKLQQYYVANQQKLALKKGLPLVGEMIAVLNFSWNRWIRAKVDHIVEFTASANKYILWAVDYGVPLQTDSRWIRELSVEFKELPDDSVYFAGLSNVVPAEKVFDFMKNCATVQISDKWSPLAVRMIDELINDAASIKFIQKYKSQCDQYFGNLEITTHTNQTIKADIVLLDTNQAITTNKFLNVVLELGTNKMPRWQTNDGNTLVFKYHSNTINVERVKYDTKTHEQPNHHEITKSEYDLEIEKKVTDWEQRNQESQFKEEVTIDDISFNDSASAAVRITPAKTVEELKEKVAHEESEESAYKVAGSSRKSRLEKYKRYVPKPPNDNDPIPFLARDVNGEIIEKISPKTNLSPENKKIQKDDFNLIDTPAISGKTNDSSDSKSGTSSSNQTNPAVNSRVAKLLNKRKSLQAKLEANPNLLSKLSQMPDNVVPAGFDMRNLQPTKADKQSKNRSYQSSSSEGKEINGLSNSIRNVGISYNSIRDKQKSRLLEEVDEICVPSNLTSHLVLVHGKHVARPIEKLANANFCEEVHRELAHMRLTNIYRIQSFSWPHLLRGNSIIVVNSARTGKTMSYLPAICSLIKMKFDDGKVHDGVGPIGIIVAPSSVEVEKISRICKRFFHSCSRKMSIVESYGIRNKEKAMSYLLNGCEILVATPPALARLLSDKVKLFDNKRLQHMVIDNIDLMHDELRSDLHLILKKCCSLNKNSSKTQVQMVVTTRSWHPLINGFLRICNNPQLCIGAYIEAAVYAQSEFKMKLMEKQCKIHEILEFLKAHPYAVERTLIVCNKDEDVEDVSEALKDASCFFISVSGKSTADEIELVSEWHHKPPGDMIVLVCSDSVLPEMKIQTAQNIINYSLPASWSKFSLRFSTLFGYYEDFVKSENIPKKDPAVALILLDEQNNSQLPKLIEFLQKHNCDCIPKEIINLSNRIKIQREEARISKRLEFCPYLMEFGKCWDKNDCRYRHVLTKFDVPTDNIPTEGTIKVKILNIVSPTHYCVRLLEHKSSKKRSTWNKVKNSNDYLKFGLEFSEYFANLDNHQTHWPININDLCVAIDANTYYRCRILDMPNRIPNKLSTVDVLLRVKLVDIGRIIPCKSSNILVLPEKFKDYPFQAVDLLLTDVVPYDFELDWDSKATDIVRQWFAKYVTDDVHVRASINFTLMDTIWVDNIILTEHLKSIASNVYGINIKKELLEKQFATVSNEAVEIITQMARECGILEKTDENALNYESSLESSQNTSSILRDSNKDDFGISGQKLSLPKEKSLLANGSDESDISPLVKQRAKKQRFSMKKPSSGSEQSVIINEKWAMLPENEFVRVLIGSFYTPNNFYVQNVRNLESMEDLYRQIDEFVALKKTPLIEPKIGLNCLAKCDGKYNRGKITKVVCDADDNKIKAMIFFCDSGLSEAHSLKDIIHTSSHIVNFIPFQAIRCKLTGITSSTNGIWTEEVCDTIYENILEVCEYLYVRPVKTYEPKMDADLRFWRHEVILVDCTSEKDVKLNEKLVEKGLAEYDPETKHFLDMIINTNFNGDLSSDDEGENWDHMNYVRPVNTSKVEDLPIELAHLQFLDVDINFTEEQALQLLNLPPSAKILPPISEAKMEESRFTELENKSIKSSKNGSIKDLNPTNSSCKKLSLHEKNKSRPSAPIKTSITKEITEGHKDPLMPQLKTLYKCPQVIWQQSDSLICLHISAPDILDYYLKVTSADLIFAAIINKELNMVLLNFLGGIDPQLTSHEIRGLTVIVRLVKSLKGFTWPRLIWEEDKLNWLKYNYDSIVVKDKQVSNTGRQILWDSLSFDDSSSFESSDSDIGYDALYDMANAEQVFDPLADDFD